MAYLKPQTPLKDINSGDYFYPLTTIDQLITGSSRLSAYFSENNNKLDLINIGSITSDNIITNNLTADNIITNNLTVGKIHSNAAAIDTDITRIPSDNEIALETGDGGGNISAWIWREQYSSSNWGIFHNNSINTLQFIGNNVAKFAVDLGSGSSYFNGEINITKNGNTVIIGSLNSGWCHFENSANIPFYFNRNVQIDGQMIQYSTAVISQSWIDGRDSAAVRVANFNNYHAGLSMKTTNGSWEVGVYTNNNLWFTYCPDANYNARNNTVAQLHIDSNAHIWGAVWNDYAEMRNVPIANDYKPDGTHSLYAGRCVYENGDDTMNLTFKRLQKGCKIISDTFGFNIGETEKCKTPIAVSGRALVYLLEGRDVAKKSIGEFVCSGPNGTVSIMTLEEYQKYPQAVVGIISAVPDYEIWGTGNIKVNGRIWIYVR